MGRTRAAERRPLEGERTRHQQPCRRGAEVAEPAQRATELRARPAPRLAGPLGPTLGGAISGSQPWPGGGWPGGHTPHTRGGLAEGEQIFLNIHEHMTHATRQQ